MKVMLSRHHCGGQEQTEECKVDPTTLSKETTMRVKSCLENILLTSLVISFLSGVTLIILGLYASWNMSYLIDHYLDPAVKHSEYTRTLVHRYGAIVPTKDDIPGEVDLGPWIMWLPSKVFNMGIAVIIFSLFGMVCVISGSTGCLYALVSLLTLSVVGQLLFISSLADIRSQLHRRIKKQLMTSLETEYEFGAATNTTFSLIMNSVMLLGECCGIVSYQDFTRHRHSFVHTGANNITHNATVLFPLACCKREYIERGFLRTMDCVLSWSIDSINEKGCYPSAFEYITEHFGPIFLWAYMGIAYVEVLQVCVALLLIYVIKEGKAKLVGKSSASFPKQEVSKETGAPELESDV